MFSDTRQEWVEMTFLRPQLDCRCWLLLDAMVN